ncbi:MAG: GreA/GreB family elongation factor [Pseudomonadota bacterium]
MHATLHGERKLTELDFARLRRLSLTEVPLELDEILDEAERVDARSIPADTVTMCARVEIQDVQTGERRILTICYPRDAQPAAGRISVLSPLGAALLGLRVGATAHWSAPTGERRSAHVIAVPFQPEAFGDYLT